MNPDTTAQHLLQWTLLSPHRAGASRQRERLFVAGSPPSPATPLRFIEGTQIHVAARPWREPDVAPLPPVGLWPRQTLLSRASGSQAGAYVILASAINRKADYPVELQDAVLFEPDGGSCFIDPRAEIIAGPVRGEETILIADESRDLVRSVKAVVDIGGHYSRPDTSSFKVNHGAAGDGESVAEIRSNSGVQRTLQKRHTPDADR